MFHVTHHWPTLCVSRQDFLCCVHRLDGWRRPVSRCTATPNCGDLLMRFKKKRSPSGPVETPGCLAWRWYIKWYIDNWNLHGPLRCFSADAALSGRWSLLLMCNWRAGIYGAAEGKGWIKKAFFFPFSVFITRPCVRDSHQRQADVTTQLSSPTPEFLNFAFNICRSPKTLQAYF